jgi:hypothetical protein
MIHPRNTPPSRRCPTRQPDRPVTVRYVCPVCGGAHPRADHPAGGSDRR